MELLDISEMSDKLRVSKSTVYGWVHRKEIPYIKVGKHLRFDYKEVIDHFRNSQQVLPQEKAPRIITNGSLTIEEMTLADPSQKED